MTRHILFAASFLAFAAHLQGAEDVVAVKSPDGRIEFRMFDGLPWDTGLVYPHLVYQVNFNGKPLIEASHLGFDVDNALPLGHKLGLITSSRETVDETYSPPSGKSKTIRNHYNEVVAEYLQNGSLGRRMTLEVRAFDDGVAFRYVIADTAPLETFRVANEITEFVFAKDGAAYPLLLQDFQTGYEDQFSKMTLSGIHPDSLVGLPFLVDQPGVGWVAVTEADLDEYAGLYLQRVEGKMMHARLAPRVDGSGLALQLKTPVVSPWRVLLIADTPQKLIESNIVASLNRPANFKDTSWIQPGKAVTGGKPAIDFAADAGLDYAIIDQSDIPYAKQKKVGVWLSADWREIEANMEESFPRFEALGVRGIKIHGMNRDDQSMVEFYHKVAAKAAEHHLMLSLYKPDGIQRTFPNVLTFDAVLGSEYAKQGARVTPEHDVMLAFTRMLAGPMDYAPGGFKNATREQFQPGATLGTRAHQLALFVVFESGLQTLADSPAAYRGEKDFDFIQAVPAMWDETRALGGEVGEYVSVARKRGADWFLGAITNWTAREISISLGFLGPGQYEAEIYSDTARETRRVSSTETLRLQLASGGGAAIRFRPRSTSP